MFSAIVLRASDALLACCGIAVLAIGVASHAPWWALVGQVIALCVAFAAGKLAQREQKRR